VRRVRAEIESRKKAVGSEQVVALRRRRRA
jgi:hypothetical protein